MCIRDRDASYDAVYFIKCLDPDAGWTDMLEDAYVLPLPDSGEFSVSVSGDLLPAGKLVQFGFETAKDIFLIFQKMIHSHLFMEILFFNV